MKKVVLAVALVSALSLAVAGCTPHTARHVASAAILTAAVVGTAHVIAHHDAHYHHAHCGHARRYRRGRWVYHYDSRWEYYDQHDGTWYTHN